MMQALLAGLGDGAERYRSALESMGLAVTMVMDEREQLDMDVASFEVVVCNALFQYDDITRYKSLEYIQLTSAGLDRVPLDYTKANDIAVRSARGVYSVPIAEWVVLGLLSLYKDSRRFMHQQQERAWVKNRGLIELTGRSVCIVGMGSVGREVAKRLKAFDTTITGVDLLPEPAESFDSVVDIEQLDGTLAASDVVVLTLPLSCTTAGLFGAERIARMKRGSVLVNVSRGGLVDEQALTDALAAGELGGAVLDVFQVEPLPEGSPLWQMRNVIISPHNSFVSDRIADRLFELIVRNLADYLEWRTETA